MSQISSLNSQQQRQFDRKILRSELKFSFARSGGPGGQGVNTSDTKAILRWNVGASKVFSSDEKKKISEALSGMINKNSELVLSCQVTRSQRQNRELVVDKFLSDLEKVLRPIVPRIATKKPRRVLTKERTTRELLSKKKQERKWKFKE